MLQVLNNANDYGYVVMGVLKAIGSYSIEGVSPSIIDRAKEPISTALNLISHEVDAECENIIIDGKNVFVIKLKRNKNMRSLNFTKDFSSQDAFLKNLVRACLNLQARKHYVNASEDERNDYVGDILSAIGYTVKDQTRRGSSATGKSSGEIDIFISKDGFPFTIVEAMNLTSVDTNIINTHLDKLFSYDTAGTKFNVCLSYVKVADFASFWTKYATHVSNYNYNLPLLSTDDSMDSEFGFSEVRIMRTTHNRSGRDVALYHLCVRIHQ